MPSTTQKPSRRQVREYVMQVLFAHRLGGESVEFLAGELLWPKMGEDEASRSFARELLDAVVSHEAEADALIAGAAHNWDLERIAAIDRVIMRMAICELKYVQSVPPKATINESLEIAKRFSTDKSAPFINGVLDAIRGELERSGQLVKQGRGLAPGPPKRSAGEPEADR
jgi:N utilization substance protein B